MGTFVALARGINVGGHRSVTMAQLRALLEDLGFAGVQSYIQSGNFVFKSRSSSPQKIESLLEKEAAEKLGLQTHFFVRTAQQWGELAAGIPFLDLAAQHPSKVYAIVLKKEPAKSNFEKWKSQFSGPENVELGKSGIYIAYPQGMGTSKLSSQVLESKLSITGTARNWNTVSKLLEMVQNISAT